MKRPPNQPDYNKLTWNPAAVVCGEKVTMGINIGLQLINTDWVRDLGPWSGPSPSHLCLLKRTDHVRSLWSESGSVVCGDSKQGFPLVRTFRQAMNLWRISLLESVVSKLDTLRELKCSHCSSVTPKEVFLSLRSSKRRKFT